MDLRLKLVLLSEYLTLQKLSLHSPDFPPATPLLDTTTCLSRDIRYSCRVRIRTSN